MLIIICTIYIDHLIDFSGHSLIKLDDAYIHIEWSWYFTTLIRWRYSEYNLYKSKSTWLVLYIVRLTITELSKIWKDLYSLLRALCAGTLSIKIPHIQLLRNVTSSSFLMLYDPRNTPFPKGYVLPTFGLYKGYKDPLNIWKSALVFTPVNLASLQLVCTPVEKFSLSFKGITFDWYYPLQGINGGPISRRYTKLKLLRVSKKCGRFELKRQH